MIQGIHHVQITIPKGEEDRDRFSGMGEDA